MDAPRALRNYRYEANPSDYQAIIGSLSFQCRNIQQHAKVSVIQLTQSVPGAIITVRRVNDIEYVYIQRLDKNYYIILSSKSDETYLIPFRVSLESVNIESSVIKKSINAEYFDSTYISPLYDTYQETCPFIYTLDHETFLIIINGGAMERNVSNRDDWHYNQYTNYPDLSIGQEADHYYASGLFNSEARSWYKKQGVGFSISPYTFFTDGATHVNRYIDQDKRLYTPTGAYSFAAGESGIIRLDEHPYGKKPFTLTADGVQTYNEVVKSTGISDMNDYTMVTILWPFIPYLCEWSYFNLQRKTGSAIPVQLSEQWFNYLFSHELNYRRADGTDVSSALRTDSEVSSFPAQEDVTSITGDSSYGTSAYSRTDTTTQVAELAMTKYHTIGSIGNLKDLYVKNEIRCDYDYSFVVNIGVARTTNFPSQYYSPEFYDDLTWECCVSHSDSTNAWGRQTLTRTNTITGTQQLIAGSIVIDAGEINMDYEHTSSFDTDQVGTASHFKPCKETGAPCPECGCNSVSISYTTQQMSVTEYQNLGVIEGDNEGLPYCEYTWQLSGGGELSSLTGTSTVYTAPATNSGCSNNATISLLVNGNVCDTLKIAINAVSGDDQAVRTWTGKRCQLLSDYIANAYITNNTYNCNGEVVYGPCEVGVQKNTYPEEVSCADAYNETISVPACFSGANTVNYLESISPVDLRTATQITNGCCPEQLL